MPVYLCQESYGCWQRLRKIYPNRSAFARELVELSTRYSPGEQYPLEVERLLETHELRLTHRLDRVRFVIKVGPALGLMGTLIPMGVSLAALAEGNIPKMAGNMVTAFTATVAGLGSGVLAYLIAMSRERWAREDLREMTHAAELAIVEKDLAIPQHHLKTEVDDEIETAA